MTELERIAALTINDCFFTILERLVGFSEVPEGESHYELSEEEGTLYERTSVHASLEMPTLEAMEADLVTYKAELVVIENARLAEVARKADLSERFEALEDVNASYGELGHYAAQPNVAIWLRDLLANEDHEEAEASIAALEAKDVEMKAALDSAQYKKDRESAYASIEEQLDMQYWDKINGTSVWEDHIAQVKLDFPKP